MRRRKRTWVQNCFLKREKEESAYVNIIERLRLQDTENYRKYFKMDVDTFEGTFQRHISESVKFRSIHRRCSIKSCS